MDRMDITGSGTFRKIIGFSMETVSGLFSFVKDRTVLLWPFLLIPCLFNSALMLFLMLITSPLLLLDLLSHIVDAIRGSCIVSALPFTPHLSSSSQATTHPIASSIDRVSAPIHPLTIQRGLRHFFGRT